MESGQWSSRWPTWSHRKLNCTTNNRTFNTRNNLTVYVTGWTNKKQERGTKLHSTRLGNRLEDNGGGVGAIIGAQKLCPMPYFDYVLALRTMVIRLSHDIGYRVVVFRSSKRNMKMYTVVLWTWGFQPCAQKQQTEQIVIYWTWHEWFFKQSCFLSMSNFT